jgi:choline dehydrogenase-like flavoprotein
VDAWSIPVLRIHCSYGDNEWKMARTVADDAAEMLEAAGARNVRPVVNISVPGFCIHECGTARMGADPKTSVLNPYAQAHDVKNLFVTDGSAFVSSGCANPTLTMMAITVRACDYLIEEMKRGNL